MSKLTSIEWLLEQQIIVERMAVIVAKLEH